MLITASTSYTEHNCPDNKSNSYRNNVKNKPIIPHYLSFDVIPLLELPGGVSISVRIDSNTHLHRHWRRDVILLSLAQRNSIYQCSHHVLKQTMCIHKVHPLSSEILWKFVEAARRLISKTLRTGVTHILHCVSRCN